MNTKAIHECVACNAPVGPNAFWIFLDPYCPTCFKAVPRDRKSEIYLAKSPCESERQYKLSCVDLGRLKGFGRELGRALYEENHRHCYYSLTEHEQQLALDAGAVTIDFKLFYSVSRSARLFKGRPLFNAYMVPEIIGLDLMTKFKPNQLSHFHPIGTLYRVPGESWFKETPQVQAWREDLTFITPGPYLAAIAGGN